MRKQTVKVRAGAGLIVPIPPGIAIGDSGVGRLTGDMVIEVRLDRYARGRLACGDFVEVVETPSKKAKE